MMNSKDKFIEFIEGLHQTNEEKKIEDYFQKIASCLMNELCINCGGKKYRIIECEIYYNDGNTHKDPYLYGSKDAYSASHQRKKLHWFFHDSGIDLTIGNGSNKMGGILIRSIIEINNNNDLPLSGPLILRKYILNSITGGAFENSNQLYVILEPIPINIKSTSEVEINTIATERINIDKKVIKDNPDYFSRKYRYIAFEFLSKSDGKEKIVWQLFFEKKITEDQAKTILGYKPSFLNK